MCSACPDNIVKPSYNGSEQQQFKLNAMSKRLELLDLPTDVLDIISEEV